jgi:hypothetical protein
MQLHLANDEIPCASEFRRTGSTIAKATEFGQNEGDGFLDLLIIEPARR